MIDAIVSFVVQKATKYLVQEAFFLGGVKNEVEQLTQELKLMLRFIEAAEKEKDKSPYIRECLSQIRDIAYETEDVLDEFMVKFHEEDALPGYLAFGQISSFQQFKEKFHFFRKGRDLHSIGKKIEGLKDRIKKLPSQRERYDLKDNGSNNREESNPRAITPVTAKQNVVGWVDEADKLLGELLDDKDPSCLIISIYGMGGLGKTTLARKLYYNERVQKTFQHHAWVCVSQCYNTHIILRNIAESFKICSDEELRKISDDDLAVFLSESLKGKGHSYLLVMDDVWKRELWDVLEATILDNRNGSRVIITTRNEYVAKGSNRRTYFHRLRFLKKHESLQLFCEKAYGSYNASQQLMDREKEIVERCDGLPLAIVVLAGLCRGKSSQQRLGVWHCLKEDNSINGLLYLGFNDLPRDLKLCFLYLGLFPEDYLIDAEQVIRLWMAEDLIKQYDELTLEDVAIWYLEELASRSLILVEKRSFGKIEKFRLHDLLRELAIRKGKDIQFLCTNPASSSTLCRRQAFYNGVEGYLSLQNHGNTRLRSLLIFNNRCEDVTELLGNLAKYSKLLRVLHIDKGSLSEISAVIPKECETLILLRYLMLQGFRSMELQLSGGSFKSLHTLHLEDKRGFPPSARSFCWVHSQICELKELRHLIGFFKGEVQIGNLTNLQTLKGISLLSWMKINPEKWYSLQELEIVEEFDEAGGIEFTLDSIGKLKSLRALHVCLIYDKSSSFGSLRALSNCPDLKILVLRGIKELPKEMDIFLPRLEHLCLSIHGAVRDDILLKCQNLPNLLSLEVRTTKYLGPRRIKCKSLGFPQLQALTLYYFAGVVEEWLVEDGAMPKLGSLRTLCEHESIIPERFRSIWTSFQSI